MYSSPHSACLIIFLFLRAFLHFILEGDENYWVCTDTTADQALERYLTNEMRDIRYLWSGETMLLLAEIMNLPTLPLGKRE
jgi:hypothetical protein